MSKEEIKRKIQECIQRMPRRDNIKKMLLFGSHLHGNAKEDSDVDLLIELQEGIGLLELIAIQEELSRYIKRRVDLGQPDALSKYIRDKVLREAEVVYERKEQASH